MKKSIRRLPHYHQLFHEIRPLADYKIYKPH